MQVGKNCRDGIVTFDNIASPAKVVAVISNGLLTTREAAAATGVSKSAISYQKNLIWESSTGNLLPIREVSL